MYISNILTFSRNLISTYNKDCEIFNYDWGIHLISKQNNEQNQLLSYNDINKV